jgi:LacI family transcriptional regulator
MQKKSINIKELALRLGLSVTTVSRVLNGKAKQYRIKEETEKKVREAAKRLHYAPNQFARGLKLDKSDTIGVIAPDISNPFFADIIKNIEKECRKKGYSVLIGDSDENPILEEQMVERFESRKVDGLIVAPVGLGFSHLIETYKRGLPMVVVDRSQQGLIIPSVTSNNYKGAYEAVELLIGYGHKKIACIQGLSDSQSNSDRVNGYTDAMKKHGPGSNDLLISGAGFTVENGYESTLRFLKTDNKPTAILALNNRISLGVLKAASEMNVSIPDKLSLISFDEQVYSAYLNTPMTTIEQDKPEIARLAVQYLFNQINGETAIDKCVMEEIPTKINMRKSIKRLL